MFSSLFTKLTKPLMKKTGMSLIRYVSKHITATTKGDVTRIRSQGDLTVDLPQTIASVGIVNLTEVVEHHITTIVGSRSHLVRFVNGGELRFAYNGAGDLIELKSRGMVASITPVGVIRYAVSQTQDKATT